MKYVLMLITFFIGTIIPIQAIVNTRLGKQIGGSLMGALMSFLTGSLCLLILNLVINGKAIMSLHHSISGPWYIWLGGLIGATFVGYITWVNQQQGVALTFALIICGQIVMSLIIDQFGLLGSAIRAITLEKILGVALIIGGIFLIKK